MIERPEKLYKYRVVDAPTPGYTERIFTHREIYFAAPTSFNDPFESRVLVSMDGTPEQKLAKLRRAVQGQKPQMDAAKVEEWANRLAATGLGDPTRTAEALSTTFRTQHGVLSLTEHADDILMWSHYADNHTGLCLEFQVDRQDRFLGARVMPVVYSDDYPVIRYFSDDDGDNVETVALRKAASWSYEAEWRVVDPKVGPGPQKFPAEILTGVIMGERISPADRSLVESWVAAYGRPLVLYQAHRESDRFALRIDPA